MIISLFCNKYKYIYKLKMYINVYIYKNVYKYTSFRAISSMIQSEAGSLLVALKGVKSFLESIFKAFHI